MGNWVSMRKRWIWSSIILITLNYNQWIKDLNVKNNSIKAPEDNMGDSIIIVWRKMAFSPMQSFRNDKRKIHLMMLRNIHKNLKD